MMLRMAILLWESECSPFLCRGCEESERPVGNMMDPDTGSDLVVVSEGVLILGALSIEKLEAPPSSHIAIVQFPP